MPIPLIVWGLIAAGGALGISGCTSQGPRTGGLRGREDDPDVSNNNHHPSDTNNNNNEAPDPDGDHYTECPTPGEELQGLCDCNEHDASIHPGATDIPYNGVDEDCADGDLVDVDGDGFVAREAGGDDCDDNRAATHPGAEERWADGRDSNCDGESHLNLEADAIHFVGESDNNVLELRAVCDVNGDGDGDAVLSSPSWSSNPATPNLGTDGEGRVYIVLGGGGVFEPDADHPENNTFQMPGDADVTLTGTNHFHLYLGSSLKCRDINADGKGDLIIGMSGYNGPSAHEYLSQGDGSGSGGLLMVRGRETWNPDYSISPTLLTSAASLNAMDAAIIKGLDGEGLGVYLHVTGDIDGDGNGEIISGYSNGETCYSMPLVSYTGVQNKGDLIERTFTHSTGDPVTSTMQCHILGAGDVDGDGLTDLLFARYGATGIQGRGEAPLIFGSTTLPNTVNFHTMGNYSGLRYLVFRGNEPGAAAGARVTMGHLNSNSNADLLVGTQENEESGRIFCVPGSEVTAIVNGLHTTYSNGDTLMLNGDVYAIGGMSIAGETPGQPIPTAIITSDTDGDGLQNVFIGDGVITNPMGGVHLFTNTSLATMAATDVGISMANQSVTGSEGSRFGLTGIGDFDINGDGVPDVAVNAPNGPNFTKKGEAYLMLGRD